MWMPTELLSEARPSQGKAWRVVEAQHQSSTRKLTKSSDAHQMLEEILEASKPPFPENTFHLGYLLKSPFRYEPPNPNGSRFRRPFARQGVFYCARKASTALAEMAFYRLLFFSASPETPLPDAATPLTLFSIYYKAQRQLDLTRSPLSRDKHLWEETQDYHQTQILADVCRDVEIEMIRYQSVRCPNRGHNLALLEPRVFTKNEPLEQQTWFLMIRSVEVEMYRSHSNREHYVFHRSLFLDDPRLQGV